MAQKSIDEEFGEVRSCVAKVLKKSKRSRNDDHWLYFRVVKEMGFNVLAKKEGDRIKLVFTMWIDEWGKLPKQSTVHRVRRELQNNLGKYLPTDPQVLIRRRIREEHIRSYYAGSSESHVYEDWRKKKYGIK